MLVYQRVICASYPIYLSTYILYYLIVSFYLPTTYLLTTYFLSYLTLSIYPTYPSHPILPDYLSCLSYPILSCPIPSIYLSNLSNFSNLIYLIYSNLSYVSYRTVSYRIYVSITHFHFHWHYFKISSHRRSGLKGISGLHPWPQWVSIVFTNSSLSLGIQSSTLWWTNIAMENHHFSWENPL